MPSGRPILRYAFEASRWTGLTFWETQAIFPANRWNYGITAAFYSA
jgi:hypothetical protein